MNYLAHAYLSFHHPEIMVGNLISDFVKGKKKFDYPDNIQKGITLHRLIDRFTDDHPATHEAKKFFRADYRLYNAVFIDVVYDYFLANDASLFTETELFNFSKEVYQVLDEHFDSLPARFATIVPYMKSYNWFYNYRSRSGIKNSFAGIVRRAAFLSESDTAFLLFEKFNNELGECYRKFFPEVTIYARQEFDKLIGTEAT